MIVQSVSAGEYAAAPAQGPRMSEICGIFRLASTLFAKMPPHPWRAWMPSWIRAPPESLM
jgi:hypothetical protein